MSWTNASPWTFATVLIAIFEKHCLFFKRRNHSSNVSCVCARFILICQLAHVWMPIRRYFRRIGRRSSVRLYTTFFVNNRLRKFWLFGKNCMNSWHTVSNPPPSSRYPMIAHVHSPCPSLSCLSCCARCLLHFTPALYSMLRFLCVQCCFSSANST